MRVDYKSKEQCCGCTACENICPNNAIVMKPDDLGFMYPQINELRCVNCNLCVKICQFHSGYIKSGETNKKIIYAARLKNEESLKKSQSGGVFFALAEKIIREGGIVYGAAFKNPYSVIHKRVDNLDDLEELRGSKYIQSDLKGIFRNVKDDLKSGISVLFAGTPCEVAGLISYVGKYLSANLVTVDLICHGVPSPKVWSDYVHYMEQKNGDVCVKANFRDKSFGWATHFETFLFKNNVIKSGFTFRMLFYKHYMLRDSCYQCPFTNLRRCSDITIGDYWGWENDPMLVDKFDDNKGISLVFLNSEKGKMFFENLDSKLFIVKNSNESYMQPNLVRPAQKNPMRDVFIQEYRKHGFLYVAKKYGNLGWRYQFFMVKTGIKNFIKMFFWKK